MNSNWFKFIMKLTKVQYGKNLKLKGIPVIYNTSGAKLQIGDNVTVNSSFLSNLVGLYQRTIIVTRTPQAELIIGDNVGISGATIYARGSIKIGDNTLVGGNAKIFDNDFHPLEIEARNKDIKEKIGTRPVVIGKNCFIGGNSIILKGTVLGDGCIVGAGAVVSGKFEDNCIIAGNPARVIKNIKEENLITI
jgi:acetyltransferase-like isoleucine patch superfamily enzyme